MSLVRRFGHYDDYHAHHLQTCSCYCNFHLPEAYFVIGASFAVSAVTAVADVADVVASDFRTE